MKAAAIADALDKIAKSLATCEARGEARANETKIPRDDQPAFLVGWLGAEIGFAKVELTSLAANLRTRRAS